MELKNYLGEIYKSAKNKFNLLETPKIILKKDNKNAEKVFGRTAHYDPNSKSITLYITKRHPKDILRSFCHEVIHHYQNERGDLNMGNSTSPTYAQDDPHLREMEKEAYLEGNLLLRDFEDNFKYN